MELIFSIGAGLVVFSMAGLVCCGFEYRRKRKVLLRRLEIGVYEAAKRK